MGRYGTPAGSAMPGIQGTGSPPFEEQLAFPFNGVLGGTYWTNFRHHLRFARFARPTPDLRRGRPGPVRPAAVHFHGRRVANGPYDIDLTLNAPHAVDQATVNNPFGVAEFERILRCSDRDANPCRSDCTT